MPRIKTNISFGIISVVFTAFLLLESCKPSEQVQDEDIVFSELQEITFSGDSGSHLPYLFTDLNDNPYISWVQTFDDSSSLHVAQIEDDQLISAKSITVSSNWFVNWADYPMVATHDGSDMLSFVLAMNGEGTYTYDVLGRVSHDAGINWGKAFVLHDDGIQAEHGFTSISLLNDAYFVTWLDGRNTAEDSGHSDHGGAMTLRAAVLDKSGAKVNEWELDDRVCDCCQTASAITENGPVVVYRNRSDSEIRDMYITRLENDDWTKPKPIFNDGWEIKGCPVNGPRIVSRKNQLACIWFTASPEPKVNVIFSSDNGESFSSPMQVNQNKPIGRVDIDRIDDDRLLATWMEGGNIKAALISNQNIVERFEIANSSENRSAGFPQLVISQNRVIMAWTDVKKKSVTLKSMTF